MKQKLLVTGGSGLLGVNIASYMKEEWDVHLLYRNRPVIMKGVGTSAIDLADYESLNKCVEKISPDVIIHTAGLTSIEECESRYFDAYESNVLSTRNLAKVSRLLDIKLVHISTDHFSNSNKKNSTEEEIEIPINNYAKTKLDAEYEILKYNNSSLIIRTNFFGWGHCYRSSFSDYIIRSLRKKQELNLFTDVYYTPIFINDLIDSIKALISSKQKGVFNVVGNERISKYEFGLALADIFELDSSLINKSSIRDNKELKPRPLDMSLSNLKLTSLLNKKINSLNESLRSLKQQELDGTSNLIKSSVLRGQKTSVHYGRHHIDEDDINAVIRTLNSSFLTQGPTVKKFEEKVASYVGAKYAVATSNLTSGLHIACIAAGVGPGDSVITSPLSFVSSSNCAIFAGATPVFADIDIKTLNIDPAAVEKKCKELGNVKAIIPVHFAGRPCDMEALKKIAKKYNVVIIEDAAHALGGSHFTGERIGSCASSLMCGFSFHPVKNIATGEGSIITTNNEEVYKQLLRLRSHGIVKGNDPYRNKEMAMTDEKVNPWYYEMQQLGFNYRITDIQCSLGISQLDKLPCFIDRRTEITKKYDAAFKDERLITTVQHETRHLSGNHLYVALIDYVKLSKTRAQVFKELKSVGINAHVHYIPIPTQPYYQDRYNISKEDYQNASSYYEQAITLPLFPSMKNSDVDSVIESLKRILNE